MHSLAASRGGVFLCAPGRSMSKSVTEKAFVFIRNVPLFRDLSDDDIRSLAAVCREKSFPKGSVVFVEGTRADSLYIVSGGSVEVWKDYYGRRPDLLAVHGKGHMVGEMALIDDLPRSATVVARTRVTAFSVARDDFHGILKRNSAVALSLLRSLSAVVRRSNEAFVDGLRKRNLELQQANEELKAAQEELLRSERLSNLGKFSSLIFHDIRNPVSVVRGYAEMTVLHREDPERVAKYAAGIMKEVERLNRFVGELLDYSRGDIRLSLSIVSLHQFFEKLRTAVGESLERAEVGLEIRCDYAEPVLFDEERMLRVFINLCDNSRKAMPSGGVISVTVDHTDTLLVMVFQDSGVGMTAEVLSHIFEPFYSISGKGGSGLGLIIVKNVVESHGGSLSIQSKVGRGTTIEIRLPLRG